ncbi:MAG TPA: PadR family transcriptional regulator [Ktedonobacterales bacterium]|nr:PadR family transcriptional regulator [Ktedonobacterales bacterium]
MQNGMAKALAMEESPPAIDSDHSHDGERRIREPSRMRGRRYEAESSRGTLQYIILGLLGARSMSGYDIKRAFDRSLATYWNAGNSQIYTTLKMLTSRGLVTSEIVLQEARPNRRVYQLTSEGRAALDSWLLEPVPSRFTKDEFLTKLFFCGQTSEEATLRHLEEHHAALLAQLEDMARALRDYGHRPTRRPRLLEYQMLVREYKDVSLRADLAVTERAIARLRANIETARVHSDP